jgi:hypothetical protein
MSSPKERRRKSSKSIPAPDDSLVSTVDEPVAFLYSQLNALLAENTKQLQEAKQQLEASVPISEYEQLQQECEV